MDIDKFMDAVDRATGDEDYAVKYYDNSDDARKPAGSKYWTHKPSTPAEEAIYNGDHLHTESNPFGLHSHIPGGVLSGAHTHGPANPQGDHHHQSSTGEMTEVDGCHYHGEKYNYPDGTHYHRPKNFG